MVTFSAVAVAEGDDGDWEGAVSDRDAFDGETWEALVLGSALALLFVFIGLRGKTIDM
ncbi:MAG: hypothetical protein AAGH78_12215 [Cyanobacteria bacterium P01_H01_bin.58]